jgi:flagellum-specific peptidoglycan hydrolase FlgJ
MSSLGETAKAAIIVAQGAALAKRTWDRSQPALNTKYGPLALKWWLVIGAATFYAGYAVKNRDRNSFTSREEFVRRLWKALAGTTLTNEARKLVIAQAALESGWGKGTAARKGYNYWNLTAGSVWNGSTVFGWDKECYIFGYLCRPKLQRFRKYDGDAEAVMDYLRFLGTTRYKDSLAALKGGRLTSFAYALRDDGFYTATKDHYTTGLRAAMVTVEKVLGPSAPRIA